MLREGDYCVIVLSGGMDSATLAYWLKVQEVESLCLSFDYGQRHKRELEAAAAIANILSWEHHVIRLDGLSPLLTGSSLTDQDVDVPHGHYEAPSMKQTIVPSRNAFMLSLAWGVASSRQAAGVATAVHAGDHWIYPDCRPSFISTMEAALNVGTSETYTGKLIAPFVYLSKTDLVRIGASLNVAYAATWTCYEGGNKHCGQCGACQERKEAFQQAYVVDPTAYES